MTSPETEAPVGNVCGFILGGSRDEAPNPSNNYSHLVLKHIESQQMPEKRKDRKSSPPLMLLVNNEKKSS